MHVQCNAGRLAILLYAVGGPRRIHKSRSYVWRCNAVLLSPIFNQDVPFPTSIQQATHCSYLLIAVIY